MVRFFRVLTQRSKGNELVVVVYEVAVDLVRDNVNVAAAADLCDRLQLRAGVDHAGRVGGRIEHEYLGVVRDGGVKLFCGDLEVRLLGRRDNDRDRARLLDHLGIADPVRRRDNDLIARVAQRHQRDIDRVLCTRGNDDLRRLIVQTAVLLQTVARRLAQIHQTCGRGVLGLVVLNSLDTGLLDVLRGREIRLAGTKADNILAFCLHLLEQRVDGERRRRLYTRCNSGNRFQCHCSALPYVSQEKCLLYFLLYASHCDFASLRCKNCKKYSDRKNRPEGGFVCGNSLNSGAARRVMRKDDERRTFFDRHGKAAAGRRFV